VVDATIVRDSDQDGLPPMAPVPIEPQTAEPFGPLSWLEACDSYFACLEDEPLMPASDELGAGQPEGNGETGNSAAVAAVLALAAGGWSSLTRAQERRRRLSAETGEARSEI
jgi:hypothetical protein